VSLCDRGDVPHEEDPVVSVVESTGYFDIAQTWVEREVLGHRSAVGLTATFSIKRSGGPGGKAWVWGDFLK
jgi:hypothetical protein